ncbi:MAG TPA: outer membrane protein assembly factor BamA [Candidatus Bathyarchaeia archaeon]|nr:outer membrane protein assembly factor BamA [Candidatus Bathyarchaeia archaeon]
MTSRGRYALSIFFVLTLASLGGGLASGARAQTPARPPAGSDIIVKELAVQGNRRVQEAVILGRVSAKVGGPFVPARLADDIRAVFALGFFDDVQAKVEDFEGGVKLTFVVTERPFVRDLNFVGNKKLDAAVLQEKSEIKLGTVYNPVEVTRAAEKLKEAYEEQGYFEVGITPDVVKLPDGDVSLTFRIAEGRKMTIDKIVIEGAQGIRPDKIKQIMLTQEREFFILRGTVQRQKLDQDIERIVQLYNDNGFIQARVETVDTQVDRANASVAIRIVVAEGPQFRVGGIDITGNKILPVEELRRRILLKPDDIYSRTKLQDSVRGITDVYGTIGRAAAEVNPQIALDVPNRKVNITLEITEGPEVFVERINITGNTRSQEKILRREIPMAEGDLFTSQKLQRAKQKLTNLNYFEKVDVKTTPGSTKDKIIVNIEVTEKPTGVFSVGGGYSSQDGAMGTVDLSQNNFLGRGLQVFLRIRGGAQTQQGTIGITDPWFLDRPLAAGFDLFSNRRVNQDYTQASVGGDVRFGGPMGDFSRWSALYRLSGENITGVASNASTELLQAEGKTILSMIGGSLTQDTRDSIQEPTRGNYFLLGGDFAGIGTNDNRFFRITVSATRHQPLWFDHLLSGRLASGYQLGWSNNPVPLFERYFLGGPNTIRSFKARDISPEDSSGTKIGGNFNVLGNLEYSVPLPFNLRAALFFDVGNVYGPDQAIGTPIDLTNLKYAVGPGIRWKSPFGPIRVDYGFNPSPTGKEKIGNIQFSMGAAF